MKTKNPYRTLGISPGASTAEIRAAYRSLALRHHPDANPEDPSAEERFKEIQRAYEFLSGSTERSSHESEIERILKRLRASLTSTPGFEGKEFVVGISSRKSCLRRRTTHHEKPFSPTGGFVRPIPPLPPRAPRSPVSPVAVLASEAPHLDL